MTRARYLALAALVFALDQVTKWAAVARLLDRPPIEVLDGVRLVLVYNHGAAFGFLNRAGGWQTALFVVIALAVMVFIIMRLGRAAVDGPQLALAYALILAGAAGNVADRLWLGYVIDFIDVYYGQWHWPAFNVADAAITMGAVLLVVDTLGWRLFGQCKPRP